MIREASNDIVPDSTRAAAAQVFIASFPLLLADMVRRAHPVPFHQFHLLPEDSAALAPGLAEDDARVVTTSAWIDLASGPVLLHLPNTHGRYLNLTLIDTSGEPFASLGSRTRDDSGLDLALTGPSWRGELPSDLVSRRAPSENVWAVSRIHALGPRDREEAVGLAQRQRLCPLGPRVTRTGPGVPMLEPPASPSLRQVGELDPAILFHRLDTIFERAPLAFQKAVGPRLAELRRTLGGPPRPADWSPELAKDLARGLADGLAAVRAAAETAQRGEAFGWRMLPDSTEDPALSALQRAARAYAGLGARVRADQLTLVCDRDEAGRPLDGGDGYRIAFPRDALPPAKASWRLSAQPATPGFAPCDVCEEDQVTAGPDGSLEIIVGRSLLRRSNNANWLQAPDGGFSLVMRMCWPQLTALTGAWRMPPVERLGSG